MQTLRQSGRRTARPVPLMPYGGVATCDKTARSCRSSPRGRPHRGSQRPYLKQIMYLGTKPYNFIGFGAMDVTKPYKFIGFGLKAVWLDFFSAFLRSGRPRPPGEAFKNAPPKTRPDCLQVPRLIYPCIKNTLVCSGGHAQR